MRTRAFLVAALTAILGACSGNAGNDDPSEATDVVTPQGGGIPNVKLTRIASLNMPVAFSARAGDDNGSYVAEQPGRIVRIVGREVRGTVLDISDLVRCCGEEGLLGITFSPNGQRLYAYYTDNSGDNRVVRFRMDDRRAVRSSRTTVIAFNHPSYSNHNGGSIYLNPDNGLLYIGTGDGGGGGDPSENAQDRGSLLGKILRIDPTPSGGGRYSSPRSNPYVGRSGRDEILHYGLRNPWRFSIDPETGMLWIGDVGEDIWEEIDRIPRSKVGANLGWDRMEGNHTYEGSEPANHHGPIYEYSHRSHGGCAVTGGHVMHDPRLPGLDGAYVFSDYCDGTIRILRLSGGRWVAGNLGVDGGSVSSFGVSANGRTYVLSLGGRVSRIDPA